MNDTKFFLGANSDNGFKSYFEQLQAKENRLQLLILKGGAGSGKSSLMKRVLSLARERGNTVEIIPCASDPESLDAVIDHTQKFAIMDGTSPHVTDPLLAGIDSHIIYTGDLWDVGKLRAKKDDADALADKIADCHKGATAYIKSVSDLLSENMRCALKSLDKKKADLLCDKLIKEAFTSDKGCERKRLLSAVSVGETVLFEKTPFALADRVYVLCDRFGAASDYILGRISACARMQSQEFIYSPCSIISGKSDHLIFPKSRVAILTQNDFLRFADGDKINMDEFYGEIPLRRHLEERLALAQSILPRAQECVKEAKLIHDELEKIYVKAMDFSGMDALFQRITRLFYNQNT